MLLWEAPWICHFWVVTLGKSFITHHRKQTLLQEAAQKSGCDGSMVIFQGKPVLFWRMSLEMFCLSADHKQLFSLFWMLVTRASLRFALPSPGWCCGDGAGGHGSAVGTVLSWASMGSALWCWREGSYGGGRGSLVLEIQELWDTLSKGSQLLGAPGPPAQHTHGTVCSEISNLLIFHSPHEGRLFLNKIQQKSPVLTAVGPQHSLTPARGSRAPVRLR